MAHSQCGILCDKQGKNGKSNFLTADAQCGYSWVKKEESWKNLQILRLTQNTGQKI